MGSRSGPTFNGGIGAHARSRRFLRVPCGKLPVFPEVPFSRPVAPRLDTFKAMRHGVLGDGCDHHAERQLTYHHQGTHLLVSTISVCGWCEQWLVLLARELDCTLFCLSGALTRSPCLFRIDGGTLVEHDSDFTPHAKVERIALPRLGCMQMASIQRTADSLMAPTPPADTRKRKRAEAEDVVAEHCVSELRRKGR